MKLIPQFCYEDDSNVHMPRLCGHADKLIGADDVTIAQCTPFDPLEGVVAVDEYDRVISFTVSPSELEDPCEVGTYTFTYVTENGFMYERIVTVRLLTYRTVIYEDGTLIINEKDVDIDANVAKHGATEHIYEPLNADGTNYVWTNEPNDLWHEETDEYVYDTITRVEIGSHIRPTSIAYWFYRLRHCIEMDLTNLDTSRCTNMNYAFAYVGYSVFTGEAVPYLDLSMFDTSKVTTMEYMFNHLYGGKVIDISSWEVASTVSTFDLFSYCNLTETIYASNEFEVPATVSYGFFSDCFNLVGGSGTAWADHLEDGNTSKFARIDGGTSAPGYFTAKA